MITSSGGWRPILEGDLAAAAAASVHEIADALRAGDGGDAEALGPSYAGGQSGLSLFFTYLANAFPDREYRPVAEAQLDRAVDAVAEMPLPAAFYGGFTGVAWVYEHLQGRLFAPADEDLNEGIDEAIGQLLDTSPWPFDYDLISGLAGFGVYVAERAKRPAARELADKIVARLSETAQEQDGGVTWWTGPHLMIPDTAAQYPQGYYNIGLAHGVPGVVGMLGELIAAGLGGDEARRLLDGAVAWIRAKARPDDGGSRYSYYFTPGENASSSRSAWCYGDPGVAASWLLAARAVADKAWAEEAIEVAVRDTKRPRDKAGVIDAGLCHGAAGLAHVYNRMYQAAGADELRDAARYWYQKALDLRKPGEGVAGYLAWSPGRGGSTELTWKPEQGLLTGASGIGLALLAATTDVAPDWDRPMLVAIPPR